MHRRLQFGMRENPASDQRHGSRFAVSGTDNESCIREDAGAPHAATSGEEDRAADSFTLAMQTDSAGRKQSFEPLLCSSEAAHLLGNIHVKTLQRYARQQRIPGYQIGGHWYFRASELDSWLRSRLNSSCYPCRLQEKSDGT
jgi:excisionase family DNA binding protein